MPQAEAFPETLQAVRWEEGAVIMLDQRRLPGEEIYLRLESAESVADAIRQMVVRGAPAIGIAAAYGVVLAANARFVTDSVTWREMLEEDLQLLAASRPTAVNLFWALERMRGRLETVNGDPAVPLLEEARAIHLEDIAANRHMGALGAALIDGPCAVLTHCNTGTLATGGFGTALGVIRQGYADGRITEVFADETRPWLQGARLTAWELHHDAIPVTLLADSAASLLMCSGNVGWVIVGSDRIAANGDVANKIGTYQLAVSARYHGVKFMVVAPTSTVDMGVPDGDAIPIETRPEDEVLSLGGQRVAAPGVGAWNPVFDVTPAELVDAIVTERGVVLQPDRAKLAELMGESG